MASDDGPNDTPTPPSGGPPAKVPSEKELARKIRKRELDRRAQRQARERTRNRIAELESQVKELRKDDSTRLSACMEQLATITHERDSLVDTVKSIEQIIRGHVLPSRQAPTATPLSPPGQSGPLPNPRDAIMTRPSSRSYSAPISFLPGTPSSTDPHALRSSGFGNGLGVVGTVPNDFSAPGCRASASTSDSQDFIEELEEEDEDEDHDDDAGIIVPPPTSPCDCAVAPTRSGPAPPKFNVWRAINRALTMRCHVSKAAQVAEDAEDEHVPVCALIEGWDVVAKSRPLSKLWRKLRAVDEVLFFNCSLTDRLAILRIMYMQLKYQFDPTPERPSQTLPHSQAIDFFVWPGLRERFVFGQHAYCNNQFWQLFASSIHVLWPFEFRDAYKKCVVTGQYQLSPMFEQRIRDLNVWTMGNDLFARFPELIADIPVTQSIGQSLTPVATPIMLQQAYLSQLKEREEQLMLEHASEQGSSQDVIDCTQAMQVFPPDLYRMAPSVFMAEYTPQSFDTNGVSHDSTPEYF
ncbi:uncharacterized protein GLRG_06387 [Colletotrichum graminicola M1.001]|uniref:BZIP transcription factor n=1 Tax=Colletotrichum graminicola (strain M1.001 / M2 / FGSC 10212) TaxID=645133 RepID=E3QK55_COLGM|nr:uncharacterized protein GLRG_06387 [Colletotrichum graminicola M1.001]EFQ31243.1 hypothetical protein GLRG_06387 [Colletotrichum graminicola M1.001]